MCYSPEADVVAGLVVGAIGIDAIRHVDDRKYLALASVPVVLAAHQLIEAFAWWGLRGQVPAQAGETAATTYLIIALGIVPFLIPYAVMRAEPNSSQRRLMVPFVLLGAVVGAAMLGSLAINGYTVTIGGRYLAYAVAIPGGGALTSLYFLAVCVPLLLSSHRQVVILGAVNVPVFLVLTMLLSQGLISLWCVWAAISSLVVARTIRETSRHRRSQQRHPMPAR